MNDLDQVIGSLVDVIAKGFDGGLPPGADCPHADGTVDWAMWCEADGWGRTRALTVLAKEVIRLRAENQRLNRAGDKP